MKRYQEELDEQLVNEALLIGGLFALAVIGVAWLAYFLISIK